MKKKLLVGWVITSLLMGGAGFFVMSNSHKTEQAVAKQETDQNKVRTWSDNQKIVYPKDDSQEAVTKAANQNYQVYGNMPMQTIETSYFGGLTTEEKALEADYVFVGTIKSSRVDYRLHPTGAPSTVYQIKVLENLKGELPVDKTILSVRYLFGPSKDQKSFLTTIDQDVIPEVDKTYVIYAAAAGEEGLVILTSGTDPSTQPLDKVPMSFDKESPKLRMRTLKSALVRRKAQQAIVESDALLDKKVAAGEDSFVTWKAQERAQGNPERQVQLDKILVD